VKFICDVHIPIKLVKYLDKSGFEALHVNTLPNSYYSKDAEITEFADRHGMILISKDADFKNSFLLNRTPKKLIKINLGNITNDNLIKSKARINRKT
jgi:predicted nuclease of predicted toxin-antitoxin system